MSGKVVVITGCTSGTGLVLARSCATLGATVVMLNRDSERATAAEQEVRSAAPSSKVLSISCDLQNFESVRAAAKKVIGQFSEDGIDVLCNNAGVMAVPDAATVDGYDVQMQTNHLSHFLLTSELWPLLTKASELRSEARVVNHTSTAAYGPKIQEKYFGKNGGNLGGDKVGCLPFSGPRWNRYHHSKLANVVFTYALKDRAAAAASKVKVLVAHPGGAATQLQVKTAKEGGISSGVANMVVSQTAEDGACGIVLCSCQTDGVTDGGFYGPPGKMGLSGMAVLNKELKEGDPASREMLWKWSEAATGKFEVR